MNYYEIFNEGAQSANTPLNNASPIQRQIIQDKIAEMPINVANRAKDFLRRNWKWLTVGAAMVALAGGTAYYNRDRISNWYNGDKATTPPIDSNDSSFKDENHTSAWSRAWEEANAAKIFDNKHTPASKSTPSIDKSNTTPATSASSSTSTSGSGLGGVTGIGNMGQFKQEITPTDSTATTPEVKISSQVNIPSNKGELNLGGTVGVDTSPNITTSTNTEPPKLIDGRGAVNIQNAKDQIMNIISDPYGNKFTEAEKVQSKLKELGYTDKDLGLTWDFMKGYFFDTPK